MIRRRDIFLSSEMLYQQLVVLKVNDHVEYQLTPCITIYSLLLLIKHVPCLCDDRVLWWSNNGGKELRGMSAVGRFYVV